MGSNKDWHRTQKSSFADQNSNSAVVCIRQRVNQQQQQRITEAETEDREVRTVLQNRDTEIGTVIENAN